MATTMTIQTTDNNTGDTQTISVTHLNPALFPESGTIPKSSYQAADTVARSIVRLSNNTYRDTIITRTESVNEILMG